MSSHEFDVFLSYNSRDRPQVRELTKLKQRKLRVWLDEDELVPGTPWQKGLERGLTNSRSVAVCIGQHQLGRWQDPEMQVALNLAATQKLSVLPILLPDASESPEISAFLQLYTWVDLREGYTADKVDRLVWGITGKKVPAQPIERIEGENPFGQLGPIRDSARFVGRVAELRRLKEMLRHGSVVIVGPTKIGKTSIMLKVATDWQGEVVGPFNFQSYVSEEDFLQQFAAELRSPAYDWSALREHLQTRKVLILLDEIDAAQAAGVSFTLFVRLRSAMNANPSCCVLATSLLLPNLLYQGAKANGSAAFGLLQPFNLGELKRSDAQLLLEHTWAPEVPSFSEGVQAELFDCAGLHPFRLQRAAFHYFEMERDAEYAWLDHWRLDLGSLL